MRQRQFSSVSSLSSLLSKKLGQRLRERRFGQRNLPHLVCLAARPDPSVLLVDVVAGRPVLEARARLLGHLLEQQVPLGRRLDVDEPAALRHQLARLLGLDPAHAVAAEVVAPGAQLHEGPRASEV